MSRTEADENARMTIGQLARAVGKSARALRLYEEKDLLVPEERSPGGFRLYGPSALVRLRWICKLSEIGLSLDDIQSMLAEIGAASNGDKAMSVLRSEYRTRLVEIDAQMQRLTALREAIEAGLRYMERCRGCPRSPLPRCCKGCIEEVGDDFPDMVAGLTAQPPIERDDDPCRRIGSGPDET